MSNAFYAKEAPKVPGWPLVGSIPQLSWRGPIEFYTQCWQRYGDTFRMQIGPRSALIVVHPDAVAEILVTQRENYVKGETYRHLRRLTGDGLITMEGEPWRKRRRLAQPGFHKDSIRALVGSVAAVTRDWLHDLRDRIAEGGVFEARHEMNRLTLDIVGETLLRSRFGANAGASAQSFSSAFEMVARRGEIPINIPRWLPTPGNRRFENALRRIDSLVYSVIAAARSAETETETQTGPPSLLAMLIRARDADTGEPLTDQELRDEVLTMMLAGHETTALLMTWGFALLHDQPQTVARMRTEVNAVLGTREPTADDLPRLGFLKQVIEEILRLRPPVWILGRDVVSDAVLAGYHVRAGELVLPVPYLTHRHVDFWPDPERFDPDRFGVAQGKQRPGWAYYPFSAGPRTCIGNFLALAEAQVIFALILQQLEFEGTTSRPVPMKPAISLRPGGPVHVRVRWHDARQKNRPLR